MQKLIVILGNDKIGAKAFKQINSLVENNDSIQIYFDGSPTLKRSVKLLKSGKLKLSWIIKMFFAELFRKNHSIQNKRFITSNKELELLIDNKTTILLFRAGLIINEKILKKAHMVHNIHCACLPDFGGIGSIPRALTSESYSQEATLHVVEKSIDSGEVIAAKKYTLDPSLSYKSNEDNAYSKGLELLTEYVSTYI